MAFRVSNLIIILALTYVSLPCAISASKFDSEVDESSPSGNHKAFQESREDIKEIVNFLTHLMKTELQLEKNRIELELGDKREKVLCSLTKRPFNPQTRWGRSIVEEQKKRGCFEGPAKRSNNYQYKYGGTRWGKRERLPYIRWG